MPVRVRGDRAAFALCFGRFLDEVLELAFCWNEQFVPQFKWRVAQFRRLPICPAKVREGMESLWEPSNPEAYLEIARSILSSIKVLMKDLYHLTSDLKDPLSAFAHAMHDAIEEGSAGLNTCSVMSISSHRYMPWCESILQKAFPNDAPTVGSRPVVGYKNTFFTIGVNREFPEPVLTPFIPLGIEKLTGGLTTFLILPREGARVMAWHVGSYPSGLGDVPFIAVWDYGRVGRTLQEPWVGGPDMNIPMTSRIRMGWTS